MMKRIFTACGLTLGILVCANGGALAQNADRYNGREGQYAGSLDARQHGYEHAYRDGADRGRADRERRAGYHPQTNESQSGTLGYEPSFGNKTQYIAGYRDGYKAGYDDGYKDQPGRYGQVYARPPNDGSWQPNRDDGYTSRSWGSTDLAFDAGYRDGVTIGQQDQTRRGHGDFRDADAYRSADLGYRASYGDRGAYQKQFRDGFERGYQDGYGRSRYPGDAGSYVPNAGGAGRPDNRGVAGTRGAQGGGSSTLTVPANRQWTATNIRVSDGQVLRFESTGEIRFTATERAGVAGSLSQQRVGGSPIPGAFAGALIGRIDNGQPFGIGDQTTIRMPAGGTLYLGVNDDNVGDNSGQFQVVISR